jgi:hypothetical protein
VEAVVMDEKSTEQRKRGVFSGREIFYFFFALLVFGALAFCASEEWSDRRERANRNRDPKLAKAREVARATGRWGGYVFSDTQVLYFDGNGQSSNSWLIYDLKQDEITDGSYLVRALDKAGDYRDALIIWGSFSGWKGNLILNIVATNRGKEASLYQWQTNSDELQVFNRTEIVPGSGKVYSTPAFAVGNGWSFTVRFRNNPGQAVLTANRDGRITTNLITNPANPADTVLRGFSDGFYCVSKNSNGATASVQIYRLTNQTAIYSNSVVKMPRAFDICYGLPDPSGRRVIWMLGVESKLNKKLRSMLPAKFAPDPAPPTWYLYSTDLRATKFKYVCAVKTDQGWPDFLWGPNADSIWLLDGDEGIKRVELK